ncbi:MAG: hypothetical protein ABIW31_05910 [Novosphingobium sp.]
MNAPPVQATKTSRAPSIARIRRSATAAAQRIPAKICLSLIVVSCDILSNSLAFTGRFHNEAGLAGPEKRLSGGMI